MPRQKSGEFDKKAYDTNYMLTKIKQIKVSLNKGKPEDEELRNWIESQPEGASGYLKRLAREDMKARNS